MLGDQAHFVTAGGPQPRQALTRGPAKKLNAYNDIHGEREVFTMDALVYFCVWHDCVVGL